MKKTHNSLKMCRTTIAWLNDPLLTGIRGGQDLIFFSKINQYCGGIRDTATVPGITTGDACNTLTACSDTSPALRNDVKRTG